MIASYIQLSLFLWFPAMWVANRFIADKKTNLVVVLLIAFGVPAIPVQGLMIQGYWFGIVGHLSVTTTLLLGHGAIVRAFPEFQAVDTDSKKFLFLIIGLIALPFYPLALGLSPFDPYRLGYQPLVLSLCVMTLSLLAWQMKRRAAAFILLIALLGYQLHVLESNNLWDYLFDPLLVLYAWVLGIKTGVRYIRSRPNTANKPIVSD